MKKSILIISSLMLSTSVFSAVDYSHCMKEFNTRMGMWGQDGFPFVIEKDGKIKTHPNVNYKIDEASKAEIIEYGDDKMGFKNKVLITRDENGALQKIENQTKMTPNKIRTGLGGSNATPYNPMMYPGMGFGMGGLAPSEAKTVNEFKIVNGKCMPTRAHGETTIGNATHGQLNYEVQLCKDVSDFLKKNPSVASCFSDSVNKKITSIFKNHRDRNIDLYKNKEEENKTGPGFGGGFGGFPGTYTPFGMSTDYIVNSLLSGENKDNSYPGFERSPAIVELHKISQLCNTGLSNVKEIVADETLWTKKSSTSDSAAPADQSKAK